MLSKIFLSNFSYNKRLDYQYFTELGNSAFDHLYCSKMRDLERLTGKAVTETKIPKEAVFRDTLNVLIGVQSSSYLFISVSFFLFHVFFSFFWCFSI